MHIQNGRSRNGRNSKWQIIKPQKLKMAEAQTAEGKKQQKQKTAEGTKQQKAQNGRRHKTAEGTKQ
jgi:hypothetical protein